MPFSFFEAALDFVDVADFADFADLGSLVDTFGSEFLDAGSTFLTEFDIPFGDIASLGGWDQIGSFAGDASWFDTFNAGSILDSIPSVSDFNISSFTDSLPSLSSIKDIASTVSTDLGGIVKTAQTGIAAYNKVAPAVNAVTSALGIQNPINQIIQPINQVIGVAGSAAGIAGGVARGTDTITGLKDKATSIFSSDPNASTARDVATGQPINTPREVSDDPFEQARLDAEAEYNRPGPTEAAVVDQLGIVDRISLGANNIVNGFKGVVTDYPGITSAVSRATGIPIDTARAVANNGFNILPDNEINAIVARNINPAFVNSFNEVRDAVTGQPINTAQPVSGTGAANPFTSVYDPETQTWSVYDNTTGQTVRTGLSEQAAILAEQDLNLNSPAIILNPNPGAVSVPNITIPGINPVTAQQAALQNAGTNIQNLVAQARQQQELRNQRQDKAQSTDWRVRLRLAPNSNYLYNSNSPGLLAPLASSTGTDGVIFPYTPAIDTAYKANYDAYDLTHSNFRGYFYKNSSVDVVNIRAQFTAQDTNEADYLLAVIHFFRSVTKMFYGQDALRGSPPPLVYLSGYGVSQFNEHPCVVSQFNYSLPTDVDYIRAGTTLSNGTNLLPNRTRQANPTNPLSYSINRLLNNGLTLGALADRPTEINGLDVNSVSYVPTKMEISIALLPIQSRSQVSKQFSLQGFSNGNLLRAGYW